MVIVHSILTIAFIILVFFCHRQGSSWHIYLLHLCNIGICGGDRRPARYDDGFGELSPSPCKLFDIRRCMFQCI